MKFLSPKDSHAYHLAQAWAKEGELQASFIVIQALLKKNPTHFKSFLAFLELFEEIDIIKAHALLNDLMAGDENWQELFCSLSQGEQALLFERHGLLSLKLKDESTAITSLQRAASLGRDSLLLWATLSYLLSLNRDISLSVKALCRALELYREPTLFEEAPFFLDKNSSQNAVSESLFLNVSLTIFPQLSLKDAGKLLLLIRNTFPNREWVTELQEIVAQEAKKQPIGLSGEHYVSSDTKNW